MSSCALSVDSRFSRRMRFSPNVRYDGPYADSNLSSRLVSAPLDSGDVGVFARHMYCSFRTS